MKTTLTLTKPCTWDTPRVDGPDDPSYRYLPDRNFAMRQIVLLVLCACAWPVLAAEPASLTFQHVLLDEKPPRSPWIKTFLWIEQRRVSARRLSA